MRSFLVPSLSPSPTLLVFKTDVSSPRVFLNSLRLRSLGGNDYDKACQYILDRFVSLNQSPDKSIYAHFTCSIDTNQVRLLSIFLFSFPFPSRQHFPLNTASADVPLNVVLQIKFVLSAINDIIIQVNLRDCGLL